MASQFSDNGYITLDELDNMLVRIQALESYLGYGTSETSPGNFININGASTNIDGASIQVIRKNIPNGSTATVDIKFSEPFAEVPIVIAGADTTKRDVAAFVDSVSKTGCKIRLHKIGTSTKAAGTSKDEYINIVAIGKSKS